MHMVDDAVNPVCFTISFLLTQGNLVTQYCRQLLPPRQPLQVAKQYLSGQSKEFRFLRTVGELYCCRSAEGEQDRDRFQVHALILEGEPTVLVTGPGGVSSAVPKTPSMYLCETDIRCTMLPI